jgi:predicted nucleotide-binding protein (sugar kinase/HSP70/actin superfamily)
MRPFEIEPGSTDQALARAKEYVRTALAKRSSLPLALLRARREMARVRCDFTRPAPRVSIIGEFWAMTTEGDGNYRLQRFLEQEGAECDVQLAMLGGFRGYKLPNLDEIAAIAHQHYDNRLRGGEGHMEVGKFILNVLHNKSHMTLSVKPFGCIWINQNECIRCGACIDVCPDDAISLQKVSLRTVMTAKA